MKKRLLIALSLLVLLSTYKPQKLFSIIKFNIKKINLENNLILKDEEIKKDLFFLYDTSIIFLNTSKIEEILKKKSIIQSFSIKKKYPNELKIIIFENKPIFVIINDNNKFYLSENINFIDYLDLKAFRDLPIVFGDKENFKILFKSMKKIDFPINLVKNYYLFESNRWNLETYKKKIIKLPSENYVKSLKNFMNLRKENKFDKYEVFDYRINNQLILK